MNIHDLQEYDSIPRPDRRTMKFIDELRQFTPDRPAAGPRISVPESELLPETARESLKRHFPLGTDGIPLKICRNEAMKEEAFLLEITETELKITAASPAGVRYGIYELEEQLAAGRKGRFERTPFIRHRITRSCFSPNSRPPLYLDELADDIDYYPEAYLDRLAHERMNGVWITLYLNEMPVSGFPERGEAAGRKLKKLQNVVDRCARYGIRCYVFMSEPRPFDGDWMDFTKSDLEKYPELGGHQEENRIYFCTSSPAGQTYLAEGVEYIFSRVRGLGGLINIMCLENSYPCALRHMYPHIRKCNCPRCSSRSAGELFSEMARVMSGAMKKHQPDAEFFGFFYVAFHMPGEPENDAMREIASAWSPDDYLMYNCETGGSVQHFGKTRIIEDYSLSQPGPSEFWLELAGRAKKMAAKIQTGCSHGDASVPYVPVPGILYDRYAGLLKAGCSAVMQCWYFGANPGLMNRAAGRLSFLPFPETKEQFLCEIAEPIWKGNADRAAAAYECFRKSASNFPEVIGFKWFGPLHHQAVFPWHLTPAGLPLAPSYTQALPVNSGDMIGECCDYLYTPAEIRELMKRMDEFWQHGVEILRQAASTPEQKREAGLAEAIGIQIAGTKRWFEFYKLRDELIFRNMDRKEAIRSLIDEEISSVERLSELCEKDPRLGYHAEVENYLFYPAKLKARAELLKKVRDEELPALDCRAESIVRWTRGINPIPVPRERNAVWRELDRVPYRIFHDDENLVFQFRQAGRTEITLDFMPAITRKVIRIELQYNRWDHESDFLPGTELRRKGDVTEIRFSRSFFDDFRPLKTAPYFFNLSTPKASLSPRHDFAPRLRPAPANPSDLLPLVWQE